MRYFRGLKTQPRDTLALGRGKGPCYLPHMSKESVQDSWNFFIPRIILQDSLVLFISKLSFYDFIYRKLLRIDVCWHKLPIKWWSSNYEFDLREEDTEEVGNEKETFHNNGDAELVTKNMKHNTKRITKIHQITLLKNILHTIIELHKYY